MSGGCLTIVDILDVGEAYAGRVLAGIVQLELVAREINDIAVEVFGNRGPVG
jgi:hypothetical protein